MKDSLDHITSLPPRTVGALDLAVNGDGRLVRFYQQGASKVLFARQKTGIQGIYINTSGGVTGGDRLDGCFAAQERAVVTLTTQGCERVYRSPDGTSARIRNTITVADTATLNWVPQETIFFDGGALDRSLTIDVAATAHALIVEPVLFGRLAMGETQVSGSYRDHVCVHVDGRLVFRDATQIVGPVSDILDRPAVMAGARAAALVIYSSPLADAALPKIRALLNDTSGASLRSDHLLIARLIAPTGQELRRMLMPMIAELTQSDPPRPWRL